MVQGPNGSRSKLKTFEVKTFEVKVPGPNCPRSKLKTIQAQKVKVENLPGPKGQN